tara:strand:- start:170 stop:484 length:315 start_codon:yes stop_codon:yes gene_type:complete
LKYHLLYFLFLSLISITEDYIVIDVRTVSEFKNGFVQDAINIEWQDISSIKDEFEKNQKIYLYCRSGNRSGKAGDILIELGFKNVENLGSLENASKYLKKKVIK